MPKIYRLEGRKDLWSLSLFHATWKTFCHSFKSLIKTTNITRSQHPTGCFCFQSVLSKKKEMAKERCGEKRE